MVAYERQISEDEFQISKLKEEIALHNEQAVRFSKQCSINKDNINRWAIAKFYLISYVLIIGHGVSINFILGH